MQTITSIASVILSLGTLAWIITLSSLLFKRVIKKQKFAFGDTLLVKSFFKDNIIKPSLIILAIFVLFLVGNSTFLELIGHYSLKNMNSGIYCYYVKLQSTDDDRVYSLPGQIRVEVDSDDDGERRHYWRDYYIEKVFFDDGSCLDFTDYEESTSLSSSVRLTDQYEEEWKCTIMNEHAFSEQVKETTHVSTYNLIELVIFIIAVLYNWLGSISLYSKKREAKESQQSIIAAIHAQKTDDPAIKDLTSQVENRTNCTSEYNDFLDKYRKG